MIFNPDTQKYELPPPRWFNKATGEYEDIKPMYFIDPNDPHYGTVAPDKVIREDDTFRQFLEEKEARRRAHIEREFLQAQRAKELQLNLSAASPPIKKQGHKRNKSDPTGLDFDEELAQKAFRETTGRMLSKRGASQMRGPGLELELQRKRELEAKYRVLKPFVPEDEQIEELPPSVNPDEVISAWRRPTVPAATPKKRAIKSEKERAQELIRQKRGRGSFRGSLWTYAATRGSYCPPAAMSSETKSGWIGEEKLVGTTEEYSARKWNQSELLTKPWWEAKPAKWKTKKELRDEIGGRLAINPTTGKLEDIAPSNTETGIREGEINLMNPQMEPEELLLM